MSSKLEILLNGEPVEVEVISSTSRSVQFILGGRTYEVSSKTSAQGSSSTVKISSRSDVHLTEIPTTGERSAVCAPMPGILTEVLVQPGEAIEAKHPLVRIEAMKMQNTIFSTSSGIVASILVRPGEEIKDGQPLVEIAAK